MYRNCITVKHSLAARFCKRADSESFYFARCPTESYKLEDQNHDVINWLPIAIRRTSDFNYSYGTPLLKSIKELIKLKK